jgi:ribose 5-phosphate isomerase B
MKIALGTDHAGYRLKECIKEFVHSLGHETIDYGCHSETSVHYPIYIKYAAESVIRGICDLAIVFGGSGNGETIAANKVRGIRCALAWNEESGRLARQHNDANCLALGGRLVAETQAKAAVAAWLNSSFEGGRHAERLAMLEIPLPPPPGFPAFEAVEPKNQGLVG